MIPGNSLPATSPALPDVQSCEAWLAKAALADPQQACSAFVELLDEIEDAPPAPEVHVRILARLHGPMLASLAELERRYTAKPLPLGATEASAFVHARDLWLALLRAWQSLSNPESEDGQPGPGSDQSLLALRALECAAGLILTNVVARRDTDSDLWHWLHRCYARAERLGVADTPVPGVRPDESTTCTACYAEILLLHLSKPSAATARDITWTRRWARRWAPKVRLCPSAENDGGPAVDLDGCSPPEWTKAGTPGASLRFVDCSEVGRSIRVRLKRLAEGAAPGDLGLGRDTTQPAAGQLLTTLLRCWTDVPLSRRFPRRRADAAAQLASGLPDIFSVLAGEAFDPGTTSRTYSHREAEQIHVFQRTLGVLDTAVPRTAGERWEMLDEAADGFRVRRSLTGVRIAHRQLVAVRPGGAPQFLLCEVRWLFEGGDHSLNLGLKALPGLPQACAVRSPLQDPARPSAWSPAFMMQPAGRAEPSLVMAAGIYQSGRELEIKIEGTRQRIRLSALLERGSDFERVEYSAA